MIPSSFRFGLIAITIHSQRTFFLNFFSYINRPLHLFFLLCPKPVHSLFFASCLSNLRQNQKTLRKTQTLSLSLAMARSGHTLFRSGMLVLVVVAALFGCTSACPSCPPGCPPAVRYRVGDSIWSIAPSPNYYNNWSSSHFFRTGDSLSNSHT